MNLEEITYSDNSVESFLNKMQSMSKEEAKQHWNDFLKRASEDESLRDFKVELSNDEDFSNFLVDLFIS